MNRTVLTITMLSLVHDALEQAQKLERTDPDRSVELRGAAVSLLSYIVRRLRERAITLPPAVQKEVDSIESNLAS